MNNNNKMGKWVVVVGSVLAAIGARTWYRNRQYDKRIKKIDTNSRQEISDTPTTAVVQQKEYRPQLTKIENLPSGCIEIERETIDNNLYGFLSQGVGVAIQDGIIANSYSGLLRCNVSTTELMKVAGGDGLRGMVTKDGKIVAQAKFFENGVSIPSGVIVFQLAAMITGLYYQHIITEQLTGIHKKLDKIIAHLQAEDSANLKLAIHKIREVGNATDTDALRKCENAIDILYKLREKVGELLSSIDIKPEISYVSNYHEVKNFTEKVYKSQYFDYVEFLKVIEIYYYIANLLKYNILMIQGCDKRHNIELVIEELNNTRWDKYVERHQAVKTSVLNYIELVKKDFTNIINSSKIKTLETEIKKSFSDVEKQLKEAEESVNNCSLFMKIINGEVVQLYSENKQLSLA